MIGVLLSLAGYTSFNLSDTIAKYLTDHLPALELVAAMFVVTLLLSPVLVPPRRLLTPLSCASRLSRSSSRPAASSTGAGRTTSSSRTP